MSTSLPPLTPDEKRVILNKGTEPPFSGALYKNTAAGIYTCRQCGAGLYRSDDKFDSGCGWPSFDDEVPGAVTQSRDADGRRVEITCTRCHGHLGHVFVGERQTPKNVRHCVNSVSMQFIPMMKLERGIFAGGCFWGVEYYFQQVPGVLAVRSGYIGGPGENPTYHQVCDGDTGHAEAVEVVFDPKIGDYASLAKLFFEIHDPTQIDRQGPDRGEQYRSAVFTCSDEQKAIVQGLIAQLTKQGLKVATQVVPATTFWPAEKYHQNYYRDHGGEPYCHRRVKRF